MVDLIGEYRHKIDAKGRLALPASFRKVLSKDLYVVNVPADDPAEQCLYVFELEDLNDWITSFFVADGGYNPRNKKHVLLRRNLKALAKDTEIDGSGRITIPASIREKAGLEKEVAIIGNTGYFEIWDAKRWDDQKAEVDLASMLFD